MSPPENPTIQSGLGGNPQDSSIQSCNHPRAKATLANTLLTGGANNKSKRRGSRSRGNKNTKRAKHAKNKKTFGGNHVPVLQANYHCANGRGHDTTSQQKHLYKHQSQSNENARYDNQATQMGGQGVRYQQYGANDSGARGGNESHPQVDTYFTSNVGTGNGTGSSSSSGVGSSSGGFGAIGSSSGGFGAIGSSSGGFGGSTGSSTSGVGSSSSGVGSSSSGVGSSSGGVGSSSSSSSGMDTAAQSCSTQSGGKRHHTRKNRYRKLSKQHKNKLRTKKRKSSRRGANKKQRSSRNGSKNRRRSAKNKTRKHHRKSHATRHVKSRKVGGNPDWSWSCNS